MICGKLGPAGISEYFIAFSFASDQTFLTPSAFEKFGKVKLFYFLYK